MNSYKWSFIIFLITVVSQVVGDFGEYAKNNHAYMLFSLSLRIYMVAAEWHRDSRGVFSFYQQKQRKTPAAGYGFQNTRYPAI